jgi:leader peptidase (prepilin peptidase) / N-methyltransferase
MTAATAEARGNVAVVAGGIAAVLLVSALLLPWPTAVASAMLGALMIVGADVDARTFLLPDFVTIGATVCGILVAALLDPFDPWRAAGAAATRAAATGLALLLVGHAYAALRKRDGLGFGDVKLAAAVGAWLPLDVIPLCFALATGGALIAVAIARLRGNAIDAATRLPFGAFLCPALWLVFYASVLPG